MKKQKNIKITKIQNKMIKMIKLENKLKMI